MVWSAAAQNVELANSWTTGLTHTAGAGSDRLLILFAGMENGKDTTLAPPPDRSVQSATYGGQSLSKVTSDVICTKNTSGANHSYFCGRIELWYLNETGIQAASNSDLVVNWTGEPPYELEEHYAAVTLRNVSQATPIGETGTDTTRTVDPLPLPAPLNVVSGDLVVVGAFSGQDSTYATPATYTEGTDQNALSSTMATVYKSITADGTEQPSMDFEDAINRQVILGAVVQKTQADLSLTKSVDDPTPDEGQDITFTIAVTNSGDPTTGVQVTDLLPDSLVFVSATFSDVTDTYNSTTGLWDLGNLGTGQSDTLYITATNEAWTDPITNVAEVTASALYDPDSTPANSNPAEDDYGEVTLTPTGVSCGCGSGIESNGTMAEKLARVLFSRRREAQLTGVDLTAPPRFVQGFGKQMGSSGIDQFVPEKGPGESLAHEVSPRDLLPVTNATDIVAVDYLREDNKRVGAVFAAATSAGEVYEHTKAICDRLRGASLEDVRLVDVNGHSFVMTKIVHPTRHVDYAISFVAYLDALGATIDSRFRLEEYTVPVSESVFNFQVWAASEAYAVRLATDILDALANGAPLSYLNGDVRPELPALYIRNGRYEGGRILLEVFNGSAVREATLSGGTVSRSEGADPEAFETSVIVTTPDERHVSRLEVHTGPIFDAAFFLEAPGLVGRDQFYVSDGTWGFAFDQEEDAADVEFDVTPERSGKTYGAGKRAVERGVAMSGDIRTWAAAFRYLQPGGLPVDATDYQYLEFTASGDAQFRVLLEKASITTSDHFGSVVKLTEQPRTYRLRFEDLRRADGSGGFVGDDLVVLSFYFIGEQGRTRSYRATITDVTFGGAAGDRLAEVPDKFELRQNYPNPFNPATTIAFDLPEADRVQVTVHDVLGRRVADLVDDHYRPGRHEVVFDAGHLPSGLYLYRLETSQGALVKTMVLLK